MITNLMITTPQDTPEKITSRKVALARIVWWLREVVWPVQRRAAGCQDCGRVAPGDRGVIDLGYCGVAA
jgi:hypothetical protein